MLRWSVRHRQRSRDREDGFTLVELLVTMVVISVALLGLMALQTKALVSGGEARQRQQATATANQVIEQLRALPWATLSKGLSPTYAVLGADPNVSSGRLRPPANSSLDEALRITTGQATDVPPLSGAGGTNVTSVTDPASGKVFTARSYVTVPSGSTGLINLTVVVTWTARAGRTSTVLARTQAYSPSGGCGSAANQPFLGACQAFFQAEASAKGPAIDVVRTSAAGEPVPAGAPLLPGGTATTLHLDLGSAGSTVSSMQAASGESTVTPAAGAITNSGAALATVAAAELKRSVSSDIGGSALPATASGTASSSVTAVSTAGGTSSLRLTPSTVQSQAVIGSTTSTTCPGPTPAGQPCTDARLSGGSATALDLLVGANTWSLVTLGAPSQPWLARTTRFGSLPGSAALGCSTISGAGCVAAEASRSLGDLAVAKGTWSGGAAASGLVTLTGYSDRVLTEYGPSSLSSTPVASRGGTLKYWNGASYTTLTLTSASNSTVTAIPQVSWTSGAQSLTAKASITISPTVSVRTNPSATCTTSACQVTSDQPSATVSVTYTLTDATGTSTFMVTTDLGSLHTLSGYKAAPA